VLTDNSKLKCNACIALGHSAFPLPVPH